MWKIAFAEDESGVPVGKNRFDFYRKKHPGAYALLKVRAQMVLTSLNAGILPREAFRRGWIHIEERGVFSIDSGVPPLRLYCCLDGRAELLVVLTLGEKKRQGADIRDAYGWADEILRR